MGCIVSLGYRRGRRQVTCPHSLQCERKTPPPRAMCFITVPGWGSLFWMSEDPLDMESSRWREVTSGRPMEILLSSGPNQSPLLPGPADMQGTLPHLPISYIGMMDWPLPTLKPYVKISIYFPKQFPPVFGQHGRKRRHSDRKLTAAKVQW